MTNADLQILSATYDTLTSFQNTALRTVLYPSSELLEEAVR